MMNKSLNFGIQRHLLHRKEQYNQSVRPFLQSLTPHTHGVIRFIPPALLPHLRDTAGRFYTMEESIRNVSQQPGVDLPSVGIDAVNSLRHLDKRLDNTDFHSLTNVPYNLQVGDVVRHVSLGHIGVVAARLPVCFESDQWVEENLGSLDDTRMQHPWYLILVSHHQGLPLDFIRYGSQLTHEKIDTPQSIGFHRCLPMYFKGFNPEKGYVPRRWAMHTPESVREYEAAAHLTLREQPPVSTRPPATKAYA